MNHNNVKITWTLFLGLIALGPIYDLISLVTELRLSALCRFLLVIFGFFLIFQLNIKITKNYILFVISSLLPIIGVSLYYVHYEIEPIVELFVVYFKFLSVIILYLAIENYIKVYRFFTYDKIMYTLCYVYLLAIPLSALIGTDTFKTYSIESGRFGFKGIVSAGNEVTGVLFFITCCFAFKYLTKRRKVDLLMFVSCVVFSPLLGTKGVVLAVLLVIMAYLFERLPLHKFIAAAMLAFFTLALIVTALFLFSQPFQDSINTNIAYFNYQYENGANNSILTLLLSGRDLKMYRVFEEAFSLVPYFIYLGGWKITSPFVEMDFIDLFLLFGIVGGTFVSCFWVKILFLNTSISLTKFKLTILLSFIFLSLTAGHILYSSITAIFAIYLSQLYLINQSEN